MTMLYFIQWLNLHRLLLCYLILGKYVFITKIDINLTPEVPTGQQQRFQLMLSRILFLFQVTKMKVKTRTKTVTETSAVQSSADTNKTKRRNYSTPPKCTFLSVRNYYKHFTVDCLYCYCCQHPSLFSSWFIHTKTVKRATCTFSSRMGPHFAISWSALSYSIISASNVKICGNC